MLHSKNTCVIFEFFSHLSFDSDQKCESLKIIRVMTREISGITRNQAILELDNLR